MLLAHVVIHAIVTALEQGEEALGGVGVGRETAKPTAALPTQQLVRDIEQLVGQTADPAALHGALARHLAE